MSAADPMERVQAMEEHRCVAHNRQGSRCGRAPVPGTWVCAMHGGKSPQVVAKAKERLLFAADKAAKRLDDLLSDPDHRIRLRAAEAILDRAGIPRRTEVSGPDGEPIPVEVRASRLAEALAEMKRQAEEGGGG